MGSALLHLILIECWPIPLSAYLFNKLINDSMTKVSMKMHGVDTSKIYAWYQKKLLLGNAPALNITFNDFALPEYSFDTLKLFDWVWLLTQWLFFLVAISLELFVICTFVTRRHLRRSYEDGEYVVFVWRLPREWWYRIHVKIMMFIAVLLPLFWLGHTLFYQSGDLEEDMVQDRFWSNINAFMGEWYTGLGFLLSLLKLGSFRVARCWVRDAPNYWHVREASNEVQKWMLRRPLPDGFIESSAGLGPKILDALWCAEHGDVTKLEKCFRFADQEEAKTVLAACKTNQRDENGSRDSQELSSLAAELPNPGEVPSTSSPLAAELLNPEETPRDS